MLRVKITAEKAEVLHQPVSAPGAAGAETS